MLKERYMVRGKRIDNGAWETGFLVIRRPYCSDARYFISDKMTGFQTPIDPDTVEPIAVSVVRHKIPDGNSREYRCPNCGVWFVAVTRVGDKFYGSTSFCGNCGQRLD